MFLVAVNGKKRIVDLRNAHAGILIFNELNHGPDSGFMRIAGGQALAAEALAEAFAEAEFVRGGQIRMVEMVVCVGIEEAIGEDGGRELHGPAEQGLESTGGPRIAAGLDGVFHGEGRIEAAGPASELCANGKEAVGEQIYSFAFKAKSGSCEAGKERNDSLLHEMPLGWRARGATSLLLDSAQTFIVGLLVLALFADGRARQRRKATLRAVIPDFDGVRDPRLNPGPSVMLFHVVEGYETREWRVPLRS